LNQSGITDFEKRRSSVFLSSGNFVLIFFLRYFQFCQNAGTTSDYAAAVTTTTAHRLSTTMIELCQPKAESQFYFTVNSTCFVH
jgi:hypothetical protein